MNVVGEAKKKKKSFCSLRSQTPPKRANGITKCGKGFFYSDDISFLCLYNIAMRCKLDV